MGRSRPVIAGVNALAGNTSTITDGSFSYSHTSSLFDISSGSNGSLLHPQTVNALFSLD